MREKRINEIKGVILFAIGLMVLGSLVRFERLDLSLYTTHPFFPPRNLLGIFGAYLGGALVFFFGRAASFFLPALILLLGVKIFRQDEVYLNLPRIAGIIVLVLSVSSLIGMFNLHNEYIKFHHAGFFGAVLANLITPYFSPLGSFIIFCTLFILSLALVTDILISSLIVNTVEKIKMLISSLREIKFLPRRPKAVQVTVQQRPVRAKKRQPRRRLAVEEDEEEEDESEEEEPSAVSPRVNIQIKKQETAREEEPKFKPRQVMIGDYRLPSVELLETPPPVGDRQIEEDLEESARILEETLEDFGICAKVTDIERGPVITRYELEPAPGVKLNRIVALGDDVALAMKAQSVRIIAPIPGKGRVGIEVPNLQSSFVFLKEVISSGRYQKGRDKLPLALGKNITGQPVVADLEGMPHLLIAGTTGSGKTVCVNSLILALLYRLGPDDLKFVMVDPKMVELMPFNGLPHLLCPVVTDSKKASAALNWVVAEMETRYQLLAKVAARNIEAYNKKAEKLPYIVVVIDEFADLMSVARDQIENAVTRLAQLSRAVGIHLILATQRPSVNVITGVIKANLPARVSFKVASKVDSRTVLDANGADKLLGKGDMLFMKPGDSKLMRIQGAFVTDKEIEQVVTFIKEQGEPSYDEEILKDKQRSGVAGGEKDVLFDEALRVVMESNQASVSILQRRMRLGYTRAARIIDQLESEGYVGPYEGSKPRKILVNREDWLTNSIAGNEEQESD